MKKYDFGKKSLAFLVGMLVITGFVNAQTPVQHQVFLFGNFADIQNKPAFLTGLEGVFAQTQSPFTLVVTGDLVDDKLEKDVTDASISGLERLINLINKTPRGNLILIPGDRDWNSSREGGEKSVGRLEELVKHYWKDMDDKRFRWVGDNACPGPESIEVNEDLVIAGLNTQWWNHPYDKPREADALCDALSTDNLKEALDDIVEECRDKNLLFVGHHPILSYGNYGGYFSFGDHLNPLPILGSYRTAFHANAGNSFDLINERMQTFIDLMETVLHSNDNLIYATGHEANQQVITFGQNYLVNSGAPESSKFVSSNENEVFHSREAGIMELTYFENGAVDLSFWNYQPGKAMQRMKPRHLFYSACEVQTEPEVLINTAFVPCKESLEKTSEMKGNYPSSVEVAAGPEYSSGWWKRLWLGSHYRSSWTQPVRTHYLDLDEIHGGLNIYKKGGGRQTTSLKFKSADGTEYTFRSINKDPIKSLDYDLRQTIAAKVIRDQTSTQHPYGALAVAPLLDKVDILHASPVLYLLPDDPKLGPFRPRYGNLFGMLEVNPGKKNDADKLFAGADEIDKSTDLFQQFYKHQNTKIQLDEFIRARLFDILVGDWSKHEDNWKWAAFDQGDFRIYRPIPRDRDHVFSRQDGIINWVADRPFGIPTIENFGYHFTGIRSLTYQARHMDRFLCSEAPKNLFLEQARYIQEHISEADIEEAIRNMPPEVYELSGKTVAAKLKSRIKELPKAAETYYRQLARQVDVTGSNENEFFDVNFQDDGSLEVQIFDVNGNDKGGTKLFDRTFFPEETKEVRLWALGGEDLFNIHGGKGRIKLRAFGGPGQDQYHHSAPARTLYYDKGDKSRYDLEGNAKVVNHWNNQIYEYRRTRFRYNSASPVIGVGYSSALGFGLNLGYSFKLWKFGKEDYHSTHSIAVGGTTRGNKRAYYSSRFHQVIRKWDLLLNASAEDPVVRNRFFGLGNTSENLTDDFGVAYFQPKVGSYLVSAGLQRQFWQHSTFTLSAGLEQNDSKKIDNTFVADHFESLFGAHQKLTTLPVGLKLDVDFRDEKGLPYRGIRTFLNFEHSTQLDPDVAANNFGVGNGWIEYYVSTRPHNTLTLGLRVGGAISYGEVPWYKLPTLGFTNGLRGYVETRYVGNSSVFFNSELRYHFGEKRTAIVPMKVGLKVFYDYGRVFYDEEESHKWHSGYGFGFFVVPKTESLTVSLSFGFSDEESAYPMFSIGAPLR